MQYRRDRESQRGRDVRDYMLQRTLVGLEPVMLFKPLGEQEALATNDTIFHA